MQLTAKDIVIKRGQRTIVDGLSWQARVGEALLLTGPNGAGKTTLLRAIAGFLPIAGGELTLSGTDAGSELAEHCHFIGHADGIKRAFTVSENLEFWAQYLAASDDNGSRHTTGEVVATALERFNLSALTDIPAAYLSAGQKRKLGLARLLVVHRPVWLLDEPTVSLDARSTERLAKVVAEHVAAGGIVVAATHIPLGLEDARELKLGVHATGQPAASTNRIQADTP